MWQFFKIPHRDGTYHDIPGDWKNYSGNFPLWRLLYDILRYIRKKFETEMDWSVQWLFTMYTDDECRGWNTGNSTKGFQMKIES